MIYGEDDAEDFEGQVEYNYDDGDYDDEGNWVDGSALSLRTKRRGLLLPRKWPTMRIPSMIWNMRKRTSPRLPSINLRPLSALPPFLVHRRKMSIRSGTRTWVEGTFRNQIDPNMSRTSMVQSEQPKCAVWRLRELHRKARRGEA